MNLVTLTIGYVFRIKKHKYLFHTSYIIWCLLIKTNRKVSFFSTFADKSGEGKKRLASSHEASLIDIVFIGIIDFVG